MKDKLTEKCESCNNPVEGTNSSRDRNWYSFSCSLCGDTWSQNVAYYRHGTGLDNTDLQLQEYTDLD